jgi:hypothetical protein
MSDIFKSNQNDLKINILKDPDDITLALADRFGLSMKHAGVAITITSVTDLMAFGIGASTVLPALRSFCLFAGSVDYR